MTVTVLVENTIGEANAGLGSEHDRLLVEAALRLRDRSDLIVLAQGSMARIAERLQQIVGLPVLASLKSGIAEVKRLLAGGCRPA